MTRLAIAQALIHPPTVLGSWWSEEGQFFATAAGALATVGAVVVALFGPRWSANRHRPRLSLESRYGAVLLHADEPAETMWLRLSNAGGRDTARDVEVRVAAASLVDGKGLERSSWTILAEDEPLSFGTPLRRERIGTRADIPPGAGRWIAFADVGSSAQIAARLGSNDDEKYARPGTGARLSIASPEMPGQPWFESDDRYAVEITVTGANFDAMRFSGTCQCMPDEETAGDEYPAVEFSWTSGLQKASSGAPSPVDKLHEAT